MSASQIFHKTHHIQLHKKEEYRHLHGAVREYVNNLKEKSQVSMSHLDQLLMTLCSFFDLEPESTITNTTSSENLDATEHPLFLIVNGHHNTMVYFSLNFRNPMKLSSNIKNLEFLNLIF
jgi:hypothetical protein